MTTRTILVTGATGQVGRALARARWPDGWQGEVVGRHRLDLNDPDAIAHVVQAGRDSAPWAAVINAAAYTAVDRAEDEVAAAWAINALAPAALAQACRSAGIPLIQVSTDYVFPGDREAAWGVADKPAPLGVYGASKLGGELAVRTSGARHAIVRTAWVVSADGHNFLKTMLRLAGEREVLRVVEDQHGSPTAAADLAAALIVVAVAMAGDPGVADGVLHFTNAGPTTWADFAREIFRQSRERGGPFATVEGIPSSAFPTKARRPANSLLATDAITTRYGIAPRPWDAAISDILDQLIGART